mgnify:FL=1
MEQFRSNQAQQGVSGQAEITVVNIQRFAEDKEKVRISDYATNLQRIFILDEAHRGINPVVAFLPISLMPTPMRSKSHLQVHRC